VLTPLAGGSSGSVFRLNRGSESFVLRTTAWPPRPDSRKALEREAPEVLAIIDWELATLGDPLLDLGRLLYPFPAADGTPGASLAIDLKGYPARAVLARHYAERTGIAVDAIDYYMVLAMYKLAALIEFNHVKSFSEPEGSLAHRIARFIPQLVAGAAGIARQSRL
jgi:hypothetical protein